MQAFRGQNSALRYVLLSEHACRYTCPQIHMYMKCAHEYTNLYVKTHHDMPNTYIHTHI